jgi:hypothetical protein
MSRSIFDGSGAAKEALHGVWELGCLATKLFGVGGVQLESHAKQALKFSEFKFECPGMLQC